MTIRVAAIGTGDVGRHGVGVVGSQVRIELDKVTETHVPGPAPEDFDITAGHIAKGTPPRAHRQGHRSGGRFVSARLAAVTGKGLYAVR